MELATTLYPAVAGVYLFVDLAFYVITAVGLYGMFQKAGQPGWAGFVPIYNIYILLKIVGRPTWWTWFLLLGIIPLIGTLALLVIAIIVAIDVAKSFGHTGGFAVGLILLPFIFYNILGWGSSTYRGPAALASGAPFGGGGQQQPQQWGAQQQYGQPGCRARSRGRRSHRRRCR